jgi:hypothetical protein
MLIVECHPFQFIRKSHRFDAEKLGPGQIVLSDHDVIMAGFIARFAHLPTALVQTGVSSNRLKMVPEGLIM